MSGLSEADDCPLCGGCGEIQATDQNCKTDQYGCPLCMSADHAETVAGLRAQLTTARLAGAKVGLKYAITHLENRAATSIGLSVIADVEFDEIASALRSVDDAEILKALEGV